MKNLTIAEGQWSEQIGKLKQKSSTFTGNDLLFLDGGKDELFEKLQLRLGKINAELRAIISTL